MAKKTKAPKSGGPCAMDDHYYPDSDAHTLVEAQEVRDDQKRHKDALKALEQKQAEAKKTAAMEAKVLQGLKDAFPKEK